MHNVSHAGASNIAEISRPFRELKEHSQKDKKVEGHPRISRSKQAKYINWFTPLLWGEIECAGKCWEPQMSPSDIVCDLKMKNPILFSKLTVQVVGRWIDRSGEKPQWSNRTLQRAIIGNLPGSHVK